MQIKEKNGGKYITFKQYCINIGTKIAKLELKKITIQFYDIKGKLTADSLKLWMIINVLTIY